MASPTQLDGANWARRLKTEGGTRRAASGGLHESPESSGFSRRGVVVLRALPFGCAACDVAAAPDQRRRADTGHDELAGREARQITDADDPALSALN